MQLDKPMNDAENYKVTMAGLQTMGFTAEEISGLQRVLASILHLGNVSYGGQETRSGQPASRLKNDAAAAALVHILSVDQDELEQVRKDFVCGLF